MKMLKNSMMVALAALAMTGLTACDGGGGWTSSVSVVVDSDSHWDRDPWHDGVEAAVTDVAQESALDQARETLAAAT